MARPRKGVIPPQLRAYLFKRRASARRKPSRKALAYARFFGVKRGGSMARRKSFGRRSRGSLMSSVKKFAIGALIGSGVGNPVAGAAGAYVLGQGIEGAAGSLVGQPVINYAKSMLGGVMGGASSSDGIKING